MKAKANIPSILSLSACLALLGGCAASPVVRSHPDTVVSYASYKSFAVMRPANLSGTRDVAVMPALIRRMREETETAFAAKGLIKSSEDAADLLILVHGGLENKLDVTERGFSYGRFGRGFAGGRYDLDSYKGGTVLVDIFDAKTRELVWRGSVVAEVSDAPKPEQVTAAIAAVIARYPNCSRFNWSNSRFPPAGMN